MIKKTLLAAASLILATSTAQAGDKELDFIVAGSTGGGFNAETQVLSAELRKLGYSVNIIQSGNCKNGPALYEKATKPTLMLYYTDYVASSDLQKGECGQVPKEDFAFLTIQYFHMICAQGNKTIEDFKNETGEVTISSEIGTSAKIAISDLEKLSGVKLKHIKYDGSGQAVKGLLSGEVDYGALYPGKAYDSIKSGAISCFTSTSNQQVNGVKPFAEVFGSEFKPGLVGYDFMLMKNVTNKKELISDFKQVLESETWKNFKVRNATALPVIDGDNHQKIFNESVEAQKELFSNN